MIGAVRRDALKQPPPAKLGSLRIQLEEHGGVDFKKVELCPQGFSIPDYTWICASKVNGLIQIFMPLAY